MISKTRIIAIDFDGVIHNKKQPIPGRRMGKPFAAAKRALEHFKHHGDHIIIHSTMALTDSGLKAIADFMEYYELPYDEIIGKPHADFYVDDKAIKHENWQDTLNEIRINTH